MRGPKRREIGHGLLAERALLPGVPSAEEFPYTLRVVSDVLASNGSTSMASVCGSTLSLMAAGVPLKAAVAGIAMGLVYDEGTYVTLTDILGSEDAFGDMDFKVAGTADAVTALQLDTKIAGLPADVLAKALLQAKEARLTILDVMAGAIAEPRDHVANSAPKIVSMEIPIDKIGEVIGPKGKVINTLQQETGADIAVDDDGMVGTVTIGAKDGNAVEEARRRISLILDPPTADVGAVYAGKVVNITKFGAFVNVLPGRDGLLHISKLSPLAGGKRINNVEDVLTLGQPIEVRVDDIDPQGKVSLSLASAPEGTADASSGDSGGGGDRERGDRGDRDRGDRDRGGRDRDRDRGDRNRDSGPSSAAAPAANGVPSFEDAFEAELVSELGDLGPGAVEAEGRSSSGGDRRPPRGRSRRR
jgi:polyribonucleotide nucleotidyltransferase